MRWKIDLVILPAFLITQALQFMDKTALNYANLFGYQKALGLEGQQFNYLSACESTAHNCASNGIILDLKLTTFSGLRRLLLWTVSLRLASRQISSTEDHGC